MRIFVLLLVVVPAVAFGQLNIVFQHPGGPNEFGQFTSSVTDGTNVYAVGEFNNPIFTSVPGFFSFGMDGSGFEFTSAVETMPTTRLIADINGNGRLGLLGNLVIGSGGSGSVFSINTDGSNLTEIFPLGEPSPASHHPYALNGQIYGDAWPQGQETSLYKVNTDGSAYQLLGDIGNAPLSAQLEHDGNFFYGANSDINSPATNIFRIKPDGSGFQVLRRVEKQGVQTLAVSNDSVFGILSGNVDTPAQLFRMSKDGTSFKVLYEFNELLNQFGNLDIVHAEGKILGVGEDQLFRINEDGTDFELLHEFDAGRPNQDLTVIGSTLYGSTRARALNAGGTDGGSLFYSIPLDAIGIDESDDSMNPSDDAPATNVVPEPGSLLVWLGLALAGLMYRRNQLRFAP